MNKLILTIMIGLLTNGSIQAQGASQSIPSPLDLVCFKEVDQVLTAYKITIKAESLSYIPEQSKKATISYSGEYFAKVVKWDTKRNMSSILYSGLKQFNIVKVNPYVYYFQSSALKIELVCDLSQNNTSQWATSSKPFVQCNSISSNTNFVGRI